MLRFATKIKSAVGFREGDLIAAHKKNTWLYARVVQQEGEMLRVVTRVTPHDMSLTMIQMGDAKDLTPLIPWLGGVCFCFPIIPWLTLHSCANTDAGQ